MPFGRLLLFVLGLTLMVSTAASANQDISDEPPPIDPPAEPLDGGGTGAVPVILKIPAIGVEADVFPVGEDTDGAMDLPPTPDTVAWWAPGFGTGVPGNVVLAAHVDWGGQLRVFGQLDQLGPGDQVVVMDDQLRELVYQVASSRWVAAEGAPVDEIFGSSDRPELTLITCGGRYDPATRQYLDRLIVRASQV